MDHDTGKSYKLNDDDMAHMQTLLSEILSMEQGQSKTETGKEHLERNDFIIEKQRAELIRGRIVNFTGRLFSSEHNRWFATDNTPLQILRDNDKRLTLTANRISISQWFSEQYDKLRQSIRQHIQPKKSRGMKQTIITIIAALIMKRKSLLLNR